METTFKVSIKQEGNSKHLKQWWALLRIRAYLFYQTLESLKTALLSIDSVHGRYVSAPPSRHSSLPYITKRCLSVLGQVSYEFQRFLLLRWRGPSEASTYDQPQKLRACGQSPLLEKPIRGYHQYFPFVQRYNKSPRTMCSLRPAPTRRN